MKKSILFFLLLLGSVVLFDACRKDNKSDADVLTSEDLATNEDFDEQNDVDIDVAVEERGGGDCPTVTLAQPWGTWPNVITIDFGDGCERPDGRVLKGKLIVHQSAELRTAGAVRSVAHENFFVDDVQVEGTRSWTNNGVSATGFLSFTKTATDMKLSYPDGSFSTWNKTRISTLIEGGGTPAFLDDVWSSTGNASGVNRNGVDFTATITEALIKKVGCRWISDGLITFTRGDRTATLNFGDGDCDRFAKLTTNSGETFTVRLRR